MDGRVSVTDCTLLQKYLAGSAQLTAEQLLAADANKDSVINITDVTEIQKISLS